MARGIFTSAPDLARKLRRYLNAYSANARHWKYSDPPPAASAPTNSLRQSTRTSRPLHNQAGTLQIGYKTATNSK